MPKALVYYIRISELQSGYVYGEMIIDRIFCTCNQLIYRSFNKYHYVLIFATVVKLNWDVFLSLHCKKNT